MTTIEPAAPPSLWGLDPDLTFLNNGSFGAPPLEIIRLRARFQEELERNPLQSLLVEYPDRLAELAPAMAAFVGADPQGFTFVPNATFGANAVLGSMPFTRGGEVLVFPHRYPAVGHAAGWFAEKAGAKLVTTRSPARIESGAQLVECYAEAIGPRTELVIVDHVSSLSGMLFPVGEIIELCRKRSVPVLVDGAHAPGQAKIEIAKWQPDFYTANFHKWLYAPRPTGFLYVSPRWRDRIRPPIISNRHGMGFHAEFAWFGTFDPTPWYCARAGLDFFLKLGGASLVERGHRLAAYGGRLLMEATGSEGYYSPDSDLFSTMFACPLPASVSDAATAAPALRRGLFEQHRIEAHFAPLGDRVWIRLSAQAFNGSRDVEKLAAAVKHLRVS